MQISLIVEWSSLSCLNTRLESNHDQKHFYKRCENQVWQPYLPCFNFILEILASFIFVFFVALRRLLLQLYSLPGIIVALFSDWLNELVMISPRIFAGIMLPEYSVDKEVTFCLCLIPRIMDEYEQDLRVLEEKHQQGLEKINIVIVTSTSNQ